MIHRDREVPIALRDRRFAMPGALIAIVVAAGLGLAAPRALATPEERVDALAEAIVETGNLPSLSIAIWRNGRIEYARAFGYADLEGRVPATTSTQYRCASVSKVITATAVARLVQEGRLDLDAPVHDYVPSWPEEPVITARQLSGHLAGVSHYRGEDRIDRSRHYDSVTESLDVFRDSERAGPPGESYVYSTHGFTLLSAVAEGASGTDFLTLLEEEVYTPLGMTDSGPDMRTSPGPNMSTLYGRNRRDAFEIGQPEDPSYKWAGGGLVSTPSDLVRLAGGYLSDFLDDELVEEMWTTQRTNDGEETGVGIVWRIGEDGQGRRVIHHSGSMGGARTTVAIWPETGEAIALMTNIVWPSDIHLTGMMMMEAWREDPSGGLEVGAAAYNGEMVRGDEAAAATGELSLEGESGWITTPEPFAEWAGDLTVERMPIRHIAGDRYALVSPFGLLPLEIRRDGDRVIGIMDRGSTRWGFVVQGDAR